MRSFYPLLRLQGESPPGSSACIERICREAGGGSLHACFSGQLPLFIRWYSTPAVRPNNAFKPNALRYTNNMARSEEHTSELQSLMSISYAVFCLKKKNTK